MRSNESSPAAPPRREFLKSSLAALGGVGLANSLAAHPAAAPASPVPQPLVGEGDVILFQGDSITDAGRSREKAAVANERPGMGGGYAWLAAAALLVSRPEEKLKLFNRGVSGNKVPQLAERWDRDCLELEPDVLSILVGVNDIWHMRNGTYDGTAETYEREYHALLTRTRAALPDVRLVVCEPFVLRCGSVDDDWFPEFDHYRAAARRVAEAHATAWVPFQAMFDEAVKYAPPEHWAKDGVHPSATGASLMAHAWLAAVEG
jgi:lysophospholipase L1-like esterase